MIKKIDLSEITVGYVSANFTALTKKLNEVIDAVNDNTLCLRAAFSTEVTGTSHKTMEKPDG